MFIRESEIADFMFEGLTELGYVVGDNELSDIVELIFDYLIEAGIIGEVEEE